MLTLKVVPLPLESDPSGAVIGEKGVVCAVARKIPDESKSSESSDSNKNEYNKVTKTNLSALKGREDFASSTITRIGSLPILAEAVPFELIPANEPQEPALTTLASPPFPRDPEKMAVMSAEGDSTDLAVDAMGVVAATGVDSVAVVAVAGVSAVARTTGEEDNKAALFAGASLNFVK